MKFYWSFILSILSLGLHASILDLKITEIMYHPIEASDTEQNFEFIEFKNTGSDPLDLDRLNVIGGIFFHNIKTYILNPGEFYVIVSDSNAFKTKYPGVEFHGQYGDVLSNSGEKITVRLITDVLMEIDYDDDFPWPILADGIGFSMVPNQTNPIGDPNESDYWTISSAVNGSPGADDPGSVSVNYNLRINEVLTHTDSPSVDAVEILNFGSEPIDISHWFLSDNKKNPDKFVFPEGTIINPDEYLVVDEHDFNVNDSGFRFNRRGEEIWLFSANESKEFTGFTTGWKFDGQFNGVSFGVHTNSEGKDFLVPQTEVSLGEENPYPKVGPLIITDIMYNPALGQEGFVIIKNITDSTVNLYHSESEDSTWFVKGIGYRFPSGRSMLPGESVVLTNIDSMDFKMKHGLHDSVQVFTYTGKLKDEGETIGIWALDRQDTLKAGSFDEQYIMPEVLIEEVSYDEEEPWPVLAGGFGYYLSRIDEKKFANDYTNWEIKSEFELPRSDVGINKLLVPEGVVFESNGMLNIQLNSKDINSINVFNTQGQIVYEAELNELESVHDIRFSPGVYFYKLNTDKAYSSGSFIKN